VTVFVVVVVVVVVLIGSKIFVYRYSSHADERLSLNNSEAIYHRFSFLTKIDVLAKLLAVNRPILCNLIYLVQCSSFTSPSRPTLRITDPQC
jgi:hypothetical protein